MKQLSNNLGQYQKAMDDLTIAGKIMDSAMNENMHDEASEVGVNKTDKLFLNYNRLKTCLQT